MTKRKKKETALNKAPVGRSAYVYFLEYKELSGMYITEKPNRKGFHKLTRDPLKAMTFKTIGEAKIYLHLSKLKEESWNIFYVTEHEFI